MKTKIEFKKDKIPFTQVANGVLQDSQLSAKAKGLYAYLYSKPDGWDFALDRIVLEMADGRDSIYSGILELENNGYLSRKKQSDGRTVYFIHFPPMFIGSYPTTPNRQQGSKPVAENPQQALEASCGKSQRGKIRSISNKEFIVIKNNTRLKSNVSISKTKNNNKEKKELQYHDTDDDGFPVKLPPTSNVKNQAAVRVEQYFSKKASEYLNRKIITTGYNVVNKLLSGGKVTEPQLKEVVDDFFDRQPSEEIATNVYMCFSVKSVNKYLATI